MEESSAASGIRTLLSIDIGVSKFRAQIGVRDLDARNLEFDSGVLHLELKMEKVHVEFATGAPLHLCDARLAASNLRSTLLYVQFRIAGPRLISASRASWQAIDAVPNARMVGAKPDETYAGARS